MRDVETIEENLRSKQDAFFMGCENADLSMSMLAARSGIPLDTLRSYRTTRARKPSIMGLAVFVKLLAGLPPELTHLGSLLIEDSGCTISRTDPTSAGWLALGEKLCATGAKIMRYQQSDGHIDHAEDADLQHDMVLIVSDGAGMIGGRHG